MSRNGRSLCLATRLRLAKKAFALTAHYDGTIAMALERLSADDSVKLGEPSCHPPRLFLDFELRQSLRYGENPHQRAAFYVPLGAAHGLAGARQLHGKALSYNNLLDLDAAWNLVEEFSRPAGVILKHTNPCGAAEQATLVEAYRKAYECDPISAFGSVLGFNQVVDPATAEEISKTFVEAVIAPGYHSEALALLQTKKNVRLMEMPRQDDGNDCRQIRSIRGGVLVQDPDRETLLESDLKVVTQRAPSPAEEEALRFAWKVAKHVKSNAIVFAQHRQVVGVGAGQMSRVDSVKIAVMKAAEVGRPLTGTVVASDAFFPFPDGVEEAARAGATAVIQPGGSVRDGDVIAAADRHGLAMVFTGMRHFRH
jgi:phosphoribosylaminoimidazolecarboxamide formyltransferase/IMP cyclohydrolase